MIDLTSCVECGRPIAYDLRAGVWVHLTAEIGHNEGPHQACPQKKVA